MRFHMHTQNNIDGNSIMTTLQFGIYGDNIVECERMLSLIQQALHCSQRQLTGNVPAPCFSMEADGIDYIFYVYPAFGRWQYDIQYYIQQGGSVLREASDIVLTRINNGNESPVLTLEFCSALPAGNQAWQRSGRAYSLVKANIPYIFVTELGGYELSADRTRKAARLPNPAIPFSFISYSEYTNRPIAIAYSMNPGADQETKNKYRNIVAGDILVNLIRAIIDNRPITQYIDQLKAKEANFVFISSENTGPTSIDSEQWRRIYQNMNVEHLTEDIINSLDSSWKKTITISVRNTFDEAFRRISPIATPIASYNLPFCVVKDAQRENLALILRQVYGVLPSYFETILNTPQDIAICWINGFKPRGDDARPDRGLLPFLRMLIGDSINVLTFVYGPATPTMVAQLQNDPQSLAQANGLWQAILALSDVIICDSLRNDGAIIQQGWMNLTRLNNANVQPMPHITPYPVQNGIGENDVDTAIHLLFSNLLSGRCFEAMCNPPGGDWSGVSLMFAGTEYRWLTLPRVSGSGGKRPDHIIQLKNIIVTIESKDYLSNLERNIGPRLNQYCVDLFNTSPQCYKTGNAWYFNNQAIMMPQLLYVSVAAFIKSSEVDKGIVLNKANTDAAFIFSFAPNLTELEIVLKSDCNSVFKHLLEFVQVPPGLNFRIVQN